MLDDLDYIARFDSQNALAIAAGQPQQLNYDVPFTAPELGQIDSVVLAGMGGSALAGLICKNWWGDRLEVPFEIVRSYELPAYVGKNTLVIVSSYSGNTEETISAFKDAQEKGANLVVVSNDGELKKLAGENNYSFVEIPTGYQPRMAVWFALKALAVIFEQLGLVKDATDELEAAQKPLAAAAESYIPQIPTAQNQAKQIAENLMGKAVWVYGSPLLSAAAYKWKINFNENSKNLASWNELPEFNHNEFISWTSHPVAKPFGVVELQSSFDHPRITKRFEISNRLLSGKMPAPIQVQAKGETEVEQLLWTILLGDFVSIYLGILNGINPTPVELIEKLKKELT